METLEDEFIHSVLTKYGTEISNLNLSNNGLKSIKKIERFGYNIVSLNLSKNKLTDISPISSLSRLIELDLSENNINNVSPLLALTTLKVLDLRGNELRSGSVTKVISHLQSLEKIFLIGNPLCADIVYYPNAIFEAQPQLFAVDNWERELITQQTNKNPLRDQLKAEYEFNRTSFSASEDVRRESKQFILYDTVNRQDSLGSQIIDEKHPASLSHIKSLEAQVNAMNEAFALQEKVLATNGRDFALFTLSNRHNIFSTHSRATLLPFTKPNSAHLISGSVTSATYHEAERKEIIEKFPYYLLLQSWRQKVIHCLVAKSFVDKELEDSYRKMKIQRQDTSIELQRLESESLKWKQHSIAQSQKSELTLQQQSQLQNELKEEKKSHLECIQALQTMRAKLSSLAAYLDTSKVQMDKYCVSEQVRFMQCSQALNEQQRRLTLATERISFLSMVVAQRQVQLRNSSAALDAERRLLQWTRVQADTKAIQKSLGESGDGGDENDKDQNADAHPYRYVCFLSDVKLSAEAEGLLKSVFRRLDLQDQGAVSLPLLLNCLLGPSHQLVMDDVSQEQQLEVAATLRNELLGLQHQDIPTLQELLLEEGMASSLLSPLGVFLGRAVGLRQWVVFLTELLRMLLMHDSGYTKSVTWGECLLALVPNPDSTSSASSDHHLGRAALSVAELRELRQLKLLGDVEWGAIPLQIPTKPTADIGNYNPSLNRNVKGAMHAELTLSGNELKDAEVARLAAERRYLMNCLQLSSRGLERRAEAIKSFFEADLRSLSLREKRLQSQLHNCREEKDAMERRLQESAVLHAATEDKLQRTLSILSEENAQLRASITSRRSEDATQLESLLQDGAAKYCRLETEFNILQRENAKKEVKNRALQRDLMRLQSQQANHADEVSSLREQLLEVQRAHQEREAELRSGLRAVEEGWVGEKRGLEKKLLELQEQLVAAKSDLLASKEEAIMAIQKAASQQQEETHAVAAVSDQPTARGNIHDAVREQMSIIRNMQHTQHQPQNERQQPHSHMAPARPLAAPAQPPDILSAQLTKLLRLAETALVGDDPDGDRDRGR